MDYLANISREMKSYFSNNRYFKLFLSLDLIFIAVGLFIYLLSDFNVPMGNVVLSIAYWITIFGFFLAFANYKMKVLAVGLFLYAIDDLYGLISGLVKYKSFSFGALLSVAIFGLLAYFAFRRGQAQKTNIEQ